MASAGSAAVTLPRVLSAPYRPVGRLPSARPRTMRLKLGLATGIALCCAVPGASALDLASPSPTARANACRSLPVTATLRTYLRAAHRRVYTQRFSGPAAKSTYYGRCGTTYYALAAFKHLV